MNELPTPAHIITCAKFLNRHGFEKAAFCLMQEAAIMQLKAPRLDVLKLPGAAIDVLERLENDAQTFLYMKDLDPIAVDALLVNGLIGPHPDQEQTYSIQLKGREWLAEHRK